MEKNIASIALFAAFIAVLSWLPKFTLFFGVPITAQSLGIMLAGTVLGAWRGGLAVLLYVAVGLAGLPVFSGGVGGIGILSTPAMGFVIGFPLAAFATGAVMQLLRKANVLSAAMIASLIGAVIVLYIPGVLGMAYILDKPILVAFGYVQLFVVGDLIKVVMAGIITQALVRAYPSGVLSR